MTKNIEPSATKATNNGDIDLRELRFSRKEILESQLNGVNSLIAVMPKKMVEIAKQDALVQMSRF
jgi:hypothetical protein